MTPATPAPYETVTISATVTDETLRNVWLEYMIGATNFTKIMYDDGTNGDLKIGDNNYTVQLQHGVHNALVMFDVVANDSAGKIGRMHSDFTVISNPPVVEDVHHQKRGPRLEALHLG